MTEKEQLEQNVAELLIPVTGTIELKELILYKEYLLPHDSILDITRTLVEINQETGICKLKTNIKKKDYISYEFYNVHYTWIRNLNHNKKLI